MEVEELLALLLGWGMRAAVQHALSSLVNRALAGAPLSDAGSRGPRGDPDEWGCDPEEEDPCLD